MDVRDLDWNLLRSLDLLLTRASVSQAARELGLSQPAMSRQLERLREVLGDPLLERRGRGLVLTPRALALREPVRAARYAVEAVLAPPSDFDPATARGRVVLALAEDALAGLLTPLTERLHAEAPGLDLRVRSLRWEVFASLDAGDVDMAVLPDTRRLQGLPQLDLSRFVVEPLFTDRFVVASGHALPLDLDGFAAAEHVLMAGAGDTDTGFVDRLLAATGRSRRVAVTVPSFLHAFPLVAHSRRVVTCPLRVLRAWAPDLPWQAPPLPMPDLPMRLAWSPRLRTDPRHRFVRDLLRRAVTPEPAGARS